jgi:hypothetical protein
MNNIYIRYIQDLCQCGLVQQIMPELILPLRNGSHLNGRRPDRRQVYACYVEVNTSNSYVMCDLFNIKIHKTPYMFRPAVAIIRGSPTLW